MDFKVLATKLLAELTDLEPNQVASALEIPPDPKLGDLAFPCFLLFKNKKPGKYYSPAEEAKIIVAHINEEKHTYIEKAVAVGPYVNIFFNKKELAKQVLSKISKEKSKYGHSNKGKNKKLLIEHTSNNPSGPIHIGRIRNSFIGDTLVRLHKAIGYHVLTHYYVNDMGKQMAVINWGIKNKVAAPKLLVEKYKKYRYNPDFEIMFTYVSAMKRAKNDGKIMQEIDEFIVQAEYNKDYAKQLNKIARKCLIGQKKTLKRFGITFDKFDFESDFVIAKKHKKFIDLLMNLPEHVVLEDGTQAVDLTKYGFRRRGGGTAFLRANGASVYIVRDLAYHEYKLGLADYNITVLGEDHKIEASELKKLLEILGILKSKRIDAVFLSFVNFDNEKISTRTGTTIPADAVLDEGIDKVLDRKIIDKKIAEKIAAGAIRYFELKVSPTKQITFNWDEALSMEGNTGPYLQYALVRASKILSKVKTTSVRSDYSLLNKSEEVELIKKLSAFPALVLEAAEQYAPHKIANYAFELAQLFSTFYEACQVMKAEEKVKAARLELVRAFKQVLSNALYLLGIEEINEM